MISSSINPDKQEYPRYQSNQETTLFIANIPRDAEALEIQHLVNSHLRRVNPNLPLLQNVELVQNSPKLKNSGPKKSRLFAFAAASLPTIKHLQALSTESSIQMGEKKLFFDFARTSNREKQLRYSRSVQLFVYSDYIQVSNLIRTLVRHGILIEWFTYQSQDRIMEIRLRLGDDSSIGRLLQVSKILLASDGLLLKTFHSFYHSMDNDLYKYRLHFKVEVSSFHLDRLYDSCQPQLHQCIRTINPSNPKILEDTMDICGTCLAIRDSIYRNASCTNYRLNRSRAFIQDQIEYGRSSLDKKLAWQKNWLIVKTSRKNKLLISNEQTKSMKSLCL